MNSPSAVLGGLRLPKHSLVPASAVDLADVEDAVFLASKYGLTPDEWQQVALRGWLGRRADGKWAAPRVGLAVPRQNGKNALIEVRELFGMVVLGERFLHTAHEVKTARKAFLRIASFFENPRKYPELAGLAKEIRKTNGQEAVVLTNGGSVEFIARSKGSGRGFTVDVLVMDEAQELNDDALAALLPTISSAPLRNPQQIYTGTPPPPNAQGEVFTRVRAAGVEGKDPRLCWMEWGMAADADLDDEDEWANANPSLGIRLGIETIRDERAAMSDDTFGRERGGLWDSQASAQVIQPDTWAKLADRGSQPRMPVCFAVDVTPDRQRTTISLAGVRADGLLHVETVQNERGTVWAVPRLVELNAKWKPVGIVVDPGSPAGSLIADLQAAGIEPLLTSARDVGQACGSFYDLSTTDRLRHLDDPLLNTALAAARKRPLGDAGAWAWHRKDSSTDITPLVGATLALWGYMKSTKPEAKKTLTRVSGRVRSS
jgi:hypothetical protein